MPAVDLIPARRPRSTAEWPGRARVVQLSPPWCWFGLMSGVLSPHIAPLRTLVQSGSCGTCWSLWNSSVLLKNLGVHYVFSQTNKQTIREIRGICTQAFREDGLKRVLTCLQTVIDCGWWCHYSKWWKEMLTQSLFALKWCHNKRLTIFIFQTEQIKHILLYRSRIRSAQSRRKILFHWLEVYDNSKKMYLSLPLKTFQQTSLHPEFHLSILLENGIRFTKHHCGCGTNYC